MDWRRVRVLASAEYFHDLILGGAGDERAHAIYEGLLDVLDPDRRSMREAQRKARDGGSAHPNRRSGSDRRKAAPRRARNVGRASGERRAGRVRRSTPDRRSR